MQDRNWSDATEMNNQKHADWSVGTEMEYQKRSHWSITIGMQCQKRCDWLAQRAADSLLAERTIRVGMEMEKFNYLTLGNRAKVGS
mgnify:CR=1 FL=1